MITDEDLVKIVREEIVSAVGYYDDEVSSQRETGLDYYFNRPRGDEKQGRSEAQSSDVADMTEALLAEIMPAYDTDTVVQFGAMSAGDEDQAATESEYCNYIFMEQNGGYLVSYQAVKDILLQKNGYIKVYVEEKQEVEIDEYSEMSELKFLEILEKAEQNQEEVQAEQDEETGVVTITRYIKSKKLKCDPCPPEEILVAADHRYLTLEEARFVCHQRAVLGTDLVQMGIDKEIVADLPKHFEDESTAKNARNTSDKEGSNFSTDISTSQYLLDESYIRVDADEDGIAELRLIMMVGDNLLVNKPIKWNTIASGAAFINSHRHIAISLFDKLKGTQDQKTAFLRQYIDNMTANNNRRVEIVEGQVRLEDVLNSRPGGVIRSKQPGMVNPIPVDDIGPSCITALNYLDKQRTERAGAALDMQSQQSLVPGDSAHGIERQMTAKEQLASLITRTVAETLLRNTFLLIHRTLREFFPGQYEAKLQNQWEAVTPSEWLPRDRIKLTAGLTFGERMRQQTSLKETLATQKLAMESGLDGILVDENKIYNTVVDITRLRGGNPNRYWIDPRSDPAKLAKKQKQEQAAQMKQAQEAANKEIFALQSNIERQKRQVDVLTQENKRLTDSQNLRFKERQHDDKMTLSYTELEKKYDTDVPGQGADDDDDNQVQETAVNE